MENKIKVVMDEATKKHLEEITESIEDTIREALRREVLDKVLEGKLASFEERLKKIESISEEIKKILQK